MARFRKKPVEVEAWLVRKPFDGMSTWMEQARLVGTVSEISQGFLIKTLEGQMLARWGDWIIQGVKGELYPCKPDIFAATYEPVRDDSRALDAEPRTCRNCGLNAGREVCRANKLCVQYARWTPRPPAPKPEEPTREQVEECAKWLCDSEAERAHARGDLVSAQYDWDFAKSRIDGGEKWLDMARAVLSRCGRTPPSTGGPAVSR